MAKLIGLDGICITNHDNNDLRMELGDYVKINGVLVIVGAEVLTHQGDYISFWPKDIPNERCMLKNFLDW